MEIFPWVSQAGIVEVGLNYLTYAILKSRRTLDLQHSVVNMHSYK
jgi:hypothetical protein